mmetsp:Transcript_4473/g.4199  ORF Transcript_4473/g.4199 Transcript_4473/m.4199 type:complete len:83 (-) Transcript_4473:1040-1288(-)
MSVYSGFSTKRQEEIYFKLITKAFNLLIKRMVSLQFLYPINQEKWVDDFSKVTQYMKILDENKSVEPKLSVTLEPVVKIFVE